MWKKLLKMRPLAVWLFKVEINSGFTTSFWFDKWSPLDILMDFTGGRRWIELGIPINTTVERVIQTYRVRRCRVPFLQQIEQGIMALKDRGLNHLADVCLWSRESSDYTPETIWWPEATPKFSSLALLAIHNRLATGDRVLKWNPQTVSLC